MIVAALLLASSAPEVLEPNTALLAYGTKETIGWAWQAARTCRAPVQRRKQGPNEFMLVFLRIEKRRQASDCLRDWFASNRHLGIKVVLIPDVAQVL